MLSYNAIPTKINVVVRKNSYQHWIQGAKLSVGQRADGSDALYISTFSIDSNAIDNSEDLPTPPTHEWNFRRNVSAVYLSDAFNTEIKAVLMNSMGQLNDEDGATLDGIQKYIEITGWTWGGKISIETYVKPDTIIDKFRIFSFSNDNDDSIFSFGNDPGAPYTTNDAKTAHLDVMGGNSYREHKYFSCTGSGINSKGSSNKNILTGFNGTVDDCKRKCAEIPECVIL